MTIGDVGIPATERWVVSFRANAGPSDGVAHYPIGVSNGVYGEGIFLNYSGVNGNAGLGGPYSGVVGSWGFYDGNSPIPGGSSVSADIGSWHQYTVEKSADVNGSSVYTLYRDGVMENSRSMLSVGLNNFKIGKGNDGVYWGGHYYNGLIDDVVVRGDIPAPACSGTVTMGNIGGVQIWLAADSLTGLNDGDKVQAWNDKSSNAYAFIQNTAGRQPTYKAGVVNGRPTVRFDAAASTALALNPAPSKFASYTTCFVASFSALSASAYQWLMGFTDVNATSTTRWGEVFVWADGTLSGLHSDEAGGYTDDRTRSPVFSSNTFSVVCNVYASGNLLSTTYKDGGSALVANPRTGSARTNSGSGSLELDIGKAGAYVNPGDVNSTHMTGDIAEIIMYNKALSSTELSVAQGYLKVKYGTP